MRPKDIDIRLRVSEAFERWHTAQERLNMIINSMDQEPAVILPHQAQDDPSILEEFQKFVINTYREWFQEVVIKLHILRDGQVSYRVYARWDIYNKCPIPDEDGNLYQSLVLFDADMMVTMPEPEPCVVMAKAKPQELILYPIPVDYVEKVEGISLLTEGLRD